MRSTSENYSASANRLLDSSVPEKRRHAPLARAFKAYHPANRDITDALPYGRTRLDHAPGMAPQDVRDALTITANLVGRLTTGSVSRPRDLLLALQTYAKLAELADFEERLERLERVHALQREDGGLPEDENESEG